jgi:hypothetical protein
LFISAQAVQKNSVNSKSHVANNNNKMEACERPDPANSGMPP